MKFKKNHHGGYFKPPSHLFYSSNLQTQTQKYDGGYINPQACEMFIHKYLNSYSGYEKAPVIDTQTRCTYY